MGVATSVGRVEVRLLGGFAVTIDGAAAEDRWRLRKAKTLVKVLALASGHRMHRDAVIDLLWPDTDPAAASNNLHQALHAARRVLGGPHVGLRDDVVVLDSVDVDVDVFEEAAAKARSSGDVTDLRMAVSSWAGELLPEDAYAEWAAPHRDRLTETHHALVVQLAAALADGGAPEEAVSLVEPVVATRSLDEPLQRVWMRVLAASGRRFDAIAVYEQLRARLDAEYAAEPDAETKAVYRQLLGTAAPVTSLPHNLAVATTSFVGRQRELAELASVLDRARLLTLTGPGGCGKSRLALEFARRLLQTTQHPDGVWLIELAGLTEGELVPSAVAAAVGVALAPMQAPIAALAEQLMDRRQLLVLDNCEHLLDAAAGLVTFLLSRCPDLMFVTTSREPLGVPGEVAYRVPSLELPDPAGEDAHPVGLSRLGAVQLFVERARETVPDFSLDKANADSVAQICHRLDGMPLALELAAARLAHLSVAELADRLDDALTVLVHRGRGRLDRQQTLAATLDWSYELLDDDERTLFRRLAVFAGGFDGDAVRAVAGGDQTDTESVLPRLVDKSLVLADTSGQTTRFRLLEVVRQYAAEQLASAGETEVSRRRHRDWFTHAAQAHDPELVGMDAAAADWFDREHDNLRAALRSALQADPPKALNLAVCLWRFWIARGLFGEGRRWLEQAMAACPEQSLLHSRALFASAVFQVRVSDDSRIRDDVQQMVALARRFGDREEQAQASHLRTLLTWIFGDYFEAAELAAQARAEAEHIGDEWIAGCVAHAQAVLALSRGEGALGEGYARDCSTLLASVGADRPAYFATATPGYHIADGDIPLAIFEETLLIGRRVRAPAARAHATYTLAWALREQGQVSAALDVLREALPMFEALNDPDGRAMTLTALGNALRVAEDVTGAREAFALALAEREALRDVRGRGVIHAGLSLVEAAAGDFDEAWAQVTRSKTMWQRSGDKAGFGVIHYHAALLRLILQDYEGALEHIRTGLRHLSGGLAPRGWAWLLLCKAEVLHRLGEAEAAEAALAEARDRMTRIGEQRGLQRAEITAKTLQSARG